MATKKCWLVPALGIASLILAGCSQTPQQKRDRHIEAGKQLLEKKDYARAILEFRNAAQAMPRDAESYYELGVAFQAVGDLRNAGGSFQKATQLDTKNMRAQLSYAEILSLSRSQEALNDANSRLKTVLSALPDDPRALGDLAITEFKLGRTDEAEKDLALALQKAPSYFQTYADIVRLKLSLRDVAGAEDTLIKATQAMPKSPQAWMLLERFYVATRRLPLAEAQVHKALDLAPKNMEALMELGRIQLALGRTSEAEQTFRAVSLLPDPGARTIHAAFLLNQGQRDAGISELEQLLRTLPESREVRTLLIRAYVSSNRSADAERLIGALLKKNRKDVDALLERAEVYIREGKIGKDQNAADNDITEALHYRPEDPYAHYLRAKLHQFRGEGLSARQELGEAVRRNPNMLQARLELARSLLSAGDAKTALETLDSAPPYDRQSEALITERNWALIAERRYPEARSAVSGLLVRQRTAEVLVQDGFLRQQANDIPGARAAFASAIEGNPKDDRALRALAGSYGKGEQGAAITKFKEYAAKYPDSAPLQALLGELLMDSGDTKSAGAHLAKAQELQPRNARVDLLLARIEILEHRPDSARTRLQSLIRSGKQVEQAGLTLGQLEETVGDYQEAIKDYEIAMGVNNRNWHTLNNLAYCLSVLGRSDEALKYAQQAKEVAPNNHDVMDTLGWVYFNKGLYDSALKELQPLADDPNAIDRYHLAMAYFKTGNVDQGRGVLRSALKIDSTLPEARLAQEMALAVRQALR